MIISKTKPKESKISLNEEEVLLRTKLYTNIPTFGGVASN